MSAQPLTIKFLIADGPQGLLWVGIVPGVHFSRPEVSDTRLFARLRPSAEEDAAKAALLAAGGANLREPEART